MTKMEAYDAMIDGMAVSHKSFSPDEYIYMDEQLILRDENDNEFESSWDVRTGDRWETDWYVCKNRAAIDKAKSIKNIGKAKGYIEDSKYQQQITQKDLLEDFSDDNVIDENKDHCRQMYMCKAFEEKKSNICEECNYVRYIAHKLRRAFPFIFGFHYIYWIIMAFALTTSDFYLSNKLYPAASSSSLFIISMMLTHYYNICGNFERKGYSYLNHKTKFNKQCTILSIAAFILVYWMIIAAPILIFAGVCTEFGSYVYIAIMFILILITWITNFMGII